MTFAEPRRFWGVLLLAFLLRTAGLGFGLPHVYHQDEPIIVHHALAIGERGWNPHFFVLPPFTIYFLFLLYAVSYLVGHGLGLISDKADFAALFLTDPSFFYLTGRFVLGVLLGTATVAVLMRIGKEFFNEKIGWVAGLFLSVSMLHTQHSHYIYADIPLTFWITGLFYFLLRFLQGPAPKDYLLIGALFGVSAATKYTAVYFLPALFAAHFLTHGQDGLRWTGMKKLVTGGLAAFIAFFILSPYVFLDWRSFLGQIKTQSGAEHFRSLFHHFRYSICNGTSMLFVALLVPGVSAMWRFSKRQCLVLSAGVIVYYGVNTVFSQAFARYMLPVLPILALAAALGWRWVSDRLRARPFLKAALFAGVLLSMSVPTLYADYLMTMPDTRDLCMKWVEQNVPQGKVVVVDNRFYAPHLAESVSQTREKLAMLDAQDTAGQKRLKLMLSRPRPDRKTYILYTLSQSRAQEQNAFLFQKPFVAMSEGALREVGAAYLILNDSEEVPAIREFRSSISSHLELKAVFSPYRNANRRRPFDPFSATSAPDSQADLFSRARLGPYLEVYQFKP